MDEPEQTPEVGEERGSLLPGLLFAWVVLYLCIVLSMYWYACRLSSDPQLALRIHTFMLGALALLLVVGMSGGRGRPVATVEPEAWLCQHCLKPYVPGAHFCPRCGAPKTFFSGTSPYERAYAQAWILGKAARHPSRNIHMVLLALGAGGTGLYALFMIGLSGSWGTPGELDWLQNGLAAAVLGFQACVYGAVAVIGILNWLRRWRGVPPRQPEIAYGCPPYFSYDSEWALPEFEVEPDDDEPEAATPAAG